MKSIEKTIMRLISSGFDPDTRSDPCRSAYGTPPVARLSAPRAPRAGRPRRRASTSRRQHLRAAAPCVAAPGSTLQPRRPRSPPRCLRLQVPRLHLHVLPGARDQDLARQRRQAARRGGRPIRRQDLRAHRWRRGALPPPPPRYPPAAPIPTPPSPRPPPPTAPAPRRPLEY